MFENFRLNIFSTLIIMFGLASTASAQDTTPSYFNYFEEKVPVAVEEDEEQALCVGPDQVREFCAAVAKGISASCPSLMAVAGCFLKSDRENFCRDACASQIGFRQRTCINACNIYLDESPGPYTFLARTFITGACAEVSHPIKKVLGNICSKVISDLEEEVAID